MDTSQSKENNLSRHSSSTERPSHVPTPDEIENKLVDDSRKAGSVAYQFNPDATDAQKDLQVKSSIPANLHHDRRASAVSLATDFEHDSTGGKDNEQMATPEDAHGLESKPARASTQMTDEERFAPSRTGWAPRFHIPDDEREDEGEESLVQPTFLETKLDDKFFGEWYHNAAVIIFACLASWIIALLGGGLGWLFLVIASCGTYYRTSIRRVRRNFRDDIIRELAKQKLETDTETTEWMNSFLVKFWPIYAPNLAESIINSVDQVLSTATPPFLDSLHLKSFILGSKPPRVEHVKTYTKTQPDIVLMDWRFSFTPNDVKDLTTRDVKNKINPKVVLQVRMGKGVVSKGLDVIVEDFAFSGLMRIKFKLQLPFPHVERIDVSFLEKPEIDYVCKPLGGEHLGFDINIIPGLESFIKEQIHSNLEPMMYDPNVFPVEIAKLLAGNPVDEAIGVVAVTLHGAHNLKNPDKFSGTPDPYTVVSINSRVPLGQTKTIHDTSNPKWNETLYIIITSFTDSLTLQVYDWNEYRKDAALGTGTFPLASLEENDEHENLSLDVVSNGRHRGVLQADVRYFPVLKGGKTDAGAIEPPPELNTGIARITVEQAKDLDGTKSFVGHLNPYAVLLLNGKEVHITKKLKRTNNPIFTNSSKEVLISDRKAARIGLMIKDDRDLSADPIVGTYQIKLNDMLKMSEKGKEWFHLGGVKTGRVKMKVEWKPVALRGVIGGGGYVNPIGVMRLHIQNARDLINVETMGKSDPYLRVLQSGIERGRTVTWKNNLNPDWDEVLYIPMHTPREKLHLEVMDEESIGRDRPLGMVELLASNYIREGEDGLYEVDDEKQQMSTSLVAEQRGKSKGTLNYTVAFYPSLNVVDPEEEEKEQEGEEIDVEVSKAMRQRVSSIGSQFSAESGPRQSVDSKANGRPSIDTALSKKLTNGGSNASITSSTEKIDVPKVDLPAEDLEQYESGFIIFKLIEGQLAYTDTYLEVVMDDHLYPSYTSPRVRSKHMVFGDVGDAFVREIEFSKITLRLVDRSDRKAESSDNAIAKLTGPTLVTLQQCLYTPTELTLRGADGSTSKVTVSLRYIPVHMKLDPTESINNMGTLRVDVLDAADLPSADRNGFSDPFCKFRLGDKDVYKSKVQKKTLHPAWNEFFETPIKSRIDANFRVEVYDWDFGEKADHLGNADIDLESLTPFEAKEVTLPLDGKSGAVRLKFLFKPDYIIRSRQGTSTFSGTFAAPGKIVGAPVKGVGMLGGGVIRGASFLKYGLKKLGNSGKDDEEHDEEADPTTNGADVPVVEVTSPQTPKRTPTSASGSPNVPHGRSRSITSHHSDKHGLGIGSIKGETGTANITIVSAAGYPRSANIRVVIKQQTSKGMKEIHKTKAVKSQQKDGTSSGSSSPVSPSNAATVVNFDPSHETHKASSVSADAQFQLQVRDHATFGSDDVLGEALFFLDDQGSSAGKERNVKVGNGYVTIKTSFAQADASSIRPSTSYTTTGTEDASADSPEPKKSRRSFLSKRSVSGAPSITNTTP